MPFEVSNIIVKLRLESSIKILFMNFETSAEYWKHARFTNTLVGNFRSRDQEKKNCRHLEIKNTYGSADNHKRK